MSLSPVIDQDGAMAIMDLAVQSLGYVAAVLVFCTFYMRTMLPLRCMAIASNMALLAYGLPLGFWPVAVLHGLLLPLNVLRLFQIRRMLAKVRLARNSEFEVGPLMSSLALEAHAQGAVRFRKGDWGNQAYFIANGEISFPEISVRAGMGQLFGEFAIFSPEHTRIASASVRQTPYSIASTNRPLCWPFISIRRSPSR
jgi:hypothetical protein